LFMVTRVGLQKCSLFQSVLKSSCFNPDMSSVSIQTCHLSHSTLRGFLQHLLRSLQRAGSCCFLLLGRALFVVLEVCFICSFRVVFACRIVCQWLCMFSTFNIPCCGAFPVASVFFFCWCCHSFCDSSDSSLGGVSWSCCVVRFVSFFG